MDLRKYKEKVLNLCFAHTYIQTDWSDVMVIVPTIIERNTASERVYDLYSCLLKERIIILTGKLMMP